MEDLDPSFSERFVQGDVIVAGDNFGCGSSREQAPLALKAAGVSLVIARFFARIFFRNAINIGLPVLEIPDHTIQSGDEIQFDLATGMVVNVTRNEKYQANQLPPVMLAIMQEGGLVAYLKKHKDFILS
jgi:3-isopropylmalate/(R)-2-methylmalate dehydratase small subunit